MRIAEIRATPGMLVFLVVQPAALLLIVLHSSADTSPPAVSRAVFGTLLTAFWAVTIRGTAAVLARDRAQGVLGRAVTGARDARLIVIGKGLGAGLTGIVAIAATTLVVLLLLGLPVQLSHPGWLAVGVAAVLVSGAAAGLLLACLFVLTRHAATLSTSVIYVVYLLGGMLVPDRMLPWAVRWLCYGISLRWLQEFLAGAATGTVDLRALVIALGLTVAYGVAGALLFERMVTRARAEATLDLF
ncbi:ABC transporter permease [Streptomyces odontomachi]|uniref:ABC transporter permease n=1 Tax=Streptomyces odontomachi TaxID=2944940 RepID=UPI00210A65E0|nr:ABC transporter permease [Streptomyces sp. ODS25]